MSKQCKKCGTYVPDEYAFCNKCGSAEFFVAGAQPQVNVNQPQTNGYGNAGQTQPSSYTNPGQVNGYQQMPTDQSWQYGAPQNTQPYQYGQVAQQPKKKKKTGLIIGIVIALVIGAIIFGIIGLAVIGACASQDGGDDYSVTLNENSESKKYAPYTKGTFDGTKYVNEWADMELICPEGFSKSPADIYSAFESDDETECGISLDAADLSSRIAITFRKIPAGATSITEDEFLDILIDSVKNNSSYKVPSSYYYANVAGYTCKKATCEVTQPFTKKLYQDMYVIKHDGYIICITVISTDPQTNNTLVNKITNVK